MNHTDFLTLSLMLPHSHVKVANGLAAPVFRALGRGGMGAVKGLNFAGEVPAMLARGGGRLGRMLGKIPGQAMEEMRAGYGGAPIFKPRVPTPSFAGPVSNQALEDMGLGSGNSVQSAMPTGATAGARAQSVAAGAGMSGGRPPWWGSPNPNPGAAASERIAGAGGEGPATGNPQQFWRPKTPMQNVGSIINQMPAERIRRAMGLATGEGRTLADVGRRGAMMGGAGLYGATVAGEAPGKMRENAQYQWQQEHPIISRVGQALGLMQPAQYRNYFNPLA